MPSENSTIIFFLELFGPAVCKAVKMTYQLGHRLWDLKQKRMPLSIDKRLEAGLPLAILSKHLSLISILLNYLVLLPSYQMVTLM